jgi:hypothetical protein
MKTRINGFEVEGTVDEIRALIELKKEVKSEECVSEPVEKKKEKKHYKKEKIIVLDNLPKITGKRKQKWWTAKEKAFLDKARHQLKPKRLAALLKRTEQSVRCQIWLLQHPEMR